MTKFITISIIIALNILITGCEEKKKDSTPSAAALFLLSRGSTGSCASGATTSISNTALGTTSASATQYTISGCDTNSLNALGFSSQNISTGATGTSVNSKIAANGDLFSAGDVNIEITFSLNSANAYLEVIGQGSGNAANIDGPAIRINPTNTQARGTGRATLANITSTTTSVGQTVTYCLDFHNESPSFHAVVWASSCTSVSTTDRNNYTGREATVPSTFPGKRIGFILNNATLTSFTVRTKVGTAVNLLEF